MRSVSNSDELMRMPALEGSVRLSFLQILLNCEYDLADHLEALQPEAWESEP